ncbi:AI-2E family transporter [Terribacillus saccharophilus]|uniref:Membrane protein n=1 Tax=Terribacillus saccharophilus TaxID=361277 RepID=A0A075LGR9_9BACI|nr:MULTISPECIES: AI-2E family transporter [Terribacillus]AIF65860.1 membrane protein [Terribacillus goriensis]MCM3226254.1 AI-2E family transporter [Terribacillus saccharophilus]MEC0282954.1 AI-2E family transporter [Terribacillus saccharophilus]MEC0292155.1 AI-2E family transporter [Terribacillus saccharophilus]MEC0302811.1 AI-2E family transporter [Terribacillus saccharophilus]
MPDLQRNKQGKFSKFFLNNKFVIAMLILFIIGLNVLVYSRVSFIFTPIVVIVKTIILPIILTGIVYYLTVPIVNYLEKKRVKRVYSIIVLYLVIIGLLTILISSVIPVLKEQTLSLIDNSTDYFEQGVDMVQSITGSNIVNQIQQSGNFDFNQILNELQTRGTSMLNNLFSNLTSFVGAVTEVIIAIVTVPFILFYLLKDGKKLPVYILKLLPVRFRSQSYEVMSEMNHQISSYIRGQIIVSFVIGILLYIGYLIIGLDYAPVLAVIAAFTSVVPYLGPAIAITPAIIIAIVTSPFMLLKLIIVWTVVQLVEGKLITPQIMGRNIRVHPITIIFVILTAGNLFGVVGVILAVPGYAILKVIVTHTFHWFKKRSHLYEETTKSN